MIMQVTQQNVQQAVEANFDLRHGLDVSTLSALHAALADGHLNPYQRQAVHELDEGIHHCSMCLFYTVMSALDASGNTMNRDSVATGLHLHEVRTLERLVDLLATRDPAVAARLRADIAATDGRRTGAEQEIAALIIESSGDFDRFSEIAQILVSDPKNAHLHRMLFTALDYLAQMKRLSIELMRDVVREGRLEGTSSYFDSIPGVLHRTREFETQDFLHKKDITSAEIVLSTEAALQHAIQQGAVERQIEELKEKIVKLKDAIQKDYELSGSGAQSDRYSHTVAWNQELAEEDRLASRLKDLQSQETR